MKDEEMAEEYYYETYTVTLNIGEEERKKNVITNFLAGLKAGRPQWHDLRKDKNDLPENKRNVWCDYGSGCGKGYYHKEDGGWWIEGHLYCSTIDAWCELPQFKR